MSCGFGQSVLVGLFAEELPHQRCFADGRGNGIRSNAFTRVLRRDVTGDHVYCPLGGTIPGQATRRLSCDT